MIKRNELLENQFKSWFEKVDYDNCDVWDKGLILNALKQLAKATDDDFYKEFLVKLTDKEVSAIDCGCCKESTYKDQFDTAYFMVGSALYFTAKVTGSGKYAEAAKNIAKNLDDYSYEMDNICESYCSQPFYMEYETLDGGKERYNDIIARYNSMRENKYEDYAKNLDDSENAVQTAYYTASLIDTMEVTEQPVYEIFRRMQDLFRESVKELIKAEVYDVKNSDDDSDIIASLLLSYCILKGCRMKALHTEKYESIALSALKNQTGDAKLQKVADIADTGCFAALCIAYAESLKNREYQDYGRGKGGALWS